MIIFIGGFEILAILLLIFACITKAAETIGSLLNVLFVLFFIKNIIQDVFFGFIKNHKGVGSILIFLLMDTVRMFLFFHTARICVNTYSMGGLSYLDGMFGFIVYLIIGGGLFLFGELCSLLHGFEKDKELGIGKLLVGDISFILLLTLFGVLIYW